MYPAFTVAEVRRAEQLELDRLGEDVLMRRAARGLATVVLEELRRSAGRVYGNRVLLVVGSGNNGGDGLWAGVTLARRGVRVSAWRTGSAVHAAGWAAFLAAGGRELDAAGALAELSRAAVVVDAVTGLGGRAGLRPEVAGFAAACATRRVPVVAVDLPSGIPADPPFVVPAPAHFPATTTVSFGGRKLCQAIEPARSACGRLVLVDIGLGTMTPEVVCWEPADVLAHWPVPGPSDDKYSRGVVGIDAGSASYPGAGVLATTGAVRAGAGMVRFVGVPEVAATVVERLPNVVAAPGRVQSLVLGSGWGRRPDGARIVAAAIDGGLPVVLDADALTLLPEVLHADVLLTPHAGELARLLDVPREQITADPVAAARQAVAQTGATVLLKGASQVVATPGHEAVELAVPGPAWTAQAGSGDLLAGICGALLAAGLPVRLAAVLAASAQALAAARQGGVPPQELDLQAALG
ncbi:MAG: NAD(P)H-hydrate dehydratase [Propionicimonas sp.]|nr:NAD(P)H-hydrate dehydratase [Propionicimonas sp.]